MSSIPSTAVPTTSVRVPTPPPAYPRAAQEAKLPSATSARNAASNDVFEAPKVHALPHSVPPRPGFPRVAAKPSHQALARRINAMLPQLVAELTPVLRDRIGWDAQLGDAQIELVDRAAMRATLHTQEGYGFLSRFFISWFMPTTFVPTLKKVMVVAPSAGRYDDATLRYQLTRALTLNAVYNRHANFFEYIVQWVISPLQDTYPAYACRAWALALGDSVAAQVAPRGRKGPWWQRLGMFALWPFEPLYVGPSRKARQFVPVLDQVARGERKGLVDRMFTHPSLCSALYDSSGLQTLVHVATEGYGREAFGADVRYLRQFNPKASSTRFSAENR